MLNECGTVSCVELRVYQRASNPDRAGFRKSFITVRKGSTFDASPTSTPLSEEFDAQVKPQLPSYVAGFAAYITLGRTTERIDVQPEIRRYQSSDDLAALTDLIHRAYAPHLKQGLRYWGTHQPSSDTEKRLNAGLGLVMLTDGQYVGTLTLRPPQPGSKVPLYREPSVYSLSQFCIAPEYKGHGLGRRLHDYALDIALKLGANTVALDTAKPATSLIQLYEAWGYAVVGECDWRPHTNYVSVVMARALTAAGAA